MPPLQGCISSLHPADSLCPLHPASAINLSAQRVCVVGRDDICYGVIHSNSSRVCAGAAKSQLCRKKVFGETRYLVVQNHISKNPWSFIFACLKEQALSWVIWTKDALFLRYLKEGNLIFALHWKLHFSSNDLRKHASLRPINSCSSLFLSRL